MQIDIYTQSFLLLSLLGACAATLGFRYHSATATKASAGEEKE